MDIRPLDDTLSAAPQVAPEDLQSIAAQGYRSVISNRPDGEAPDQPTAAEIATAAKAAGLEFRHIPVVGGAIGAADVAAFKAALTDLPGPILGFCRTGTRTTTLWALARKDEQSADALIATAGAAGYDLAGLKPRLESTL